MELKYIISDGELCHYGIKGMKWGVRRYQNSDGSLTAKGKERYHDTKSGMSKYACMLPTDPTLDIPSSYKQDTFKEVLRSTNANGEHSWVSPLDDSIRFERFNTDYLLDPDSVFDQHMVKINNKHGEETGTTDNCSKVSATMCLAKLGYDYDAGRSNSGIGTAFEYWFDGAQRTVCDNLSEAIDQKFSKTGNNSFGTVDMRNKNGGGHVFNWERNSKGEFALYEGQASKGEKFTGSTVKECFDKYVSKRPWFSTDSTVRIYDMTNASPNFDHMTEDSVVRITDDPSRKSMILDTNNNKYFESL